MANQKFKTMLGVTADRDKIKPKSMTSLKLDGIRCICKDVKLFSRSLKPIRNIRLQEKFKDMINYTKDHDIIFDGEFYSHDLTFQEITSMVNSSDKAIPNTYQELLDGYEEEKPSPNSNSRASKNNWESSTDRRKELAKNPNHPIKLEFHCFDFIKDGNFTMPFEDRIKLLLDVEIDHVLPVKQFIIYDIEDIDKMFDKALDEGYEGLIVRHPKGEYKFGRSTINQGWMLKLKPFETFDTKVLGFVERMENLNESQTNELGRSFKRDTKADKRPTGIASALVTEYEGHEMKVTLTGDEAFRKEIWDNQSKYIGKMFEWKAMKVGMKDVPRHPNFLRWREDKDE